MAEPGTYEDAVENCVELSEIIKKRLIRDNSGVWRELHQSISIWNRFDELTGRLKLGVYDKVFRADFAISRAMVDKAVKEAERSDLPLDTCFQTVVLEARFAAIAAEVDADIAARKHGKPE